MELVSTMEMNGEEREIADAYAREQIATNAQNIATNAEGIAGLNNNLDNQKALSFTLGDLSWDVGSELPSTAWKRTTFINVLPNTKYKITRKNNSTCNILGYNLGKSAITDGTAVSVHANGLYSGNAEEIEFTTTSTTEYIRFAIADSDTTENINFELGSFRTAIDELTVEVGQINNNLSQLEIDLKMLGYTVPKEMPVQNYVDSDGVFHQRVGRVDLGSLKYVVQTAYNRIITAVSVDSIKSVIVTNLPNAYTDYCRTETSYNAWNNKGTIDRCLVIESNTPPDISIYSPPSDLSELKGHYLYYELAEEKAFKVDGNEAVTKIKNDLSKQCKKDDITTNETLIGTFNGKNYYRKLFTGISGSGGSITVNVGGKIEIYNYYGRAYTYGQSGASDVKYPIPNKNYYIDSQNASETSFQLTIPTSSDTRKVDLVIEYTKVDE